MLRLALVFVTVTWILSIGTPFSEGEVRFTDVTATAKADDTGKSITVSFNDYNGDGKPDILIGNGNRPNTLLRNDGNTFTDVSKDSGIFNEDIGTKTWSGSSVIFGDYDNDGDLDIFIATDAWPPDPEFQPCRSYLYRNNGDGTFTDVTLEAGVTGLETGTYGAVFADYDNDGFLDLYVVNLGDPNILYRNNGDGTFTDVTENAGVPAGAEAESSSVAAVFFDADNDGDLDLYAINAYGPLSFFYLNNGDGTFKDESKKSGLADPGDPTGVAVGDYDNDGDLDIYIANYFVPNVLYQNNGDGTFQNVASDAGVDIEDNCRATAFIDYNNDGYLDLLVTRKDETSILFENLGDGTFKDVSKQVGLTEKMGTSAVSIADYDLDGDLDIYFANGGPANKGASNALYRNDGDGSGNWLQIRVKSKYHIDGIGTQVKLITGKNSRVAEVSGGYGTYQLWLGVHFGLASQGWVDNVEVRFPNGTVVATNQPVKSNQVLVVSEDGFEGFIPAGVTPNDKKPVILADIRRFALLQNYPNPFNPETWIPFALGRDSDVTINIYDVSGRLIRRLELGVMKAGYYTSKDEAAYWDGRDEYGDRVSSGLYLYTIKAGDFTETRRMVLIK
jgi:hypothetical protein